MVYDQIIHGRSGSNDLVYAKVILLQFTENLLSTRASLMAQTVKTRVRSLSWEDLLQKGVTTHSNILAWRIPGTEKPDGLQSMGSWRVGHDWATNTFTLTKYQQSAMHLTLSHSLSRVQLFATPWTVAHQTPLSMGFSRREYWSGLPCSPPGMPDQCTH